MCDNHLKNYFHKPEKVSSSTIWERHNIVWLQGQEVILSGYGRADSPGHCVKYGTYSMIDLSCNKMIDFKLVQVCFS